jgi:hypothetical protein
VLGFAEPSTSLSILCKNTRLKPFCQAQRACFDFPSSNFNFRGHKLSTAGVAHAEPFAALNPAKSQPEEI